MSQGAYVGSFEAVRDFRAALVTFLHEARDALGTHDIEVRRSLGWLLEVQPKFWQQEVRRREQAVTEAKIELERCRTSKLPGGDAPSCMEEKKALERARQRRDAALDKVDVVRRWGHAFEREASEYTGRANQLSSQFDADLPAAIATLDRVLNALEAYTALAGSAAVGSARSASMAAPPPPAELTLDAEPAPNGDAGASPDETSRSQAP